MNKNESDKILIENFLGFLTTEFQSDRHLRHVQFEKWSLNDYKVGIRCYYKGKEGNIFVDLRELQDNPNYFNHLKDNIIDQLRSLIGDVLV